MWWKFFKAVRRGEYKLAPTTWLTAVAAIFYALTPVDIIPEIIFGPIGLIDDLGVLGYLVMVITREKNKWEVEQGPQAPPAAPETRNATDATWSDESSR